MSRIDLERLGILWERATSELIAKQSGVACSAVANDATAGDGEQVEFFFSGDCRLRMVVQPGPQCRLHVAQLMEGDSPDDDAAFTAEREQTWLQALDACITSWLADVASEAGVQLELDARATSVPAEKQNVRAFAVRGEGMDLPFTVRMELLPKAAPRGEVQQPIAEEDSRELGNVDLLLDVELQATLRFGTREMQLGDVLGLGPGDVVPLDRPVQAPVELVVGDRIVARGDVVVVDGNYGLRVTELAMPQQRLESIRCLF